MTSAKTTVAAPDQSSNILIVDDTPDNLRLLSQTLSQHGYEVQCAINGKLALMAVRNSLPDLILLDIKMPGMDGYEVCSELKNDSETAQVPVIFLSALDEVQDKVSAFAVGGVDYITKPFQVEEVLARVKSQLTICQLRRQLEAQNFKLQQLNEDLTRSNQELEEFAYIVSHDLQQPLQTITGFAELILDSDAIHTQIDQDEELEEYVSPILQEGIRMQQLIQNLLRYSRANANLHEFEIVDCNQLLEETSEKLHNAITQSGAVIDLGDLPKVWGDRIQLGQLFQNLVSNAIKYSAPDTIPKVEISVTPLGRDWRFMVQDNGIGIQPRDFKRIFQIFQRLHTDKEYPGDGIGLTVCQKIIKRHGGEIWVESEPGSGTCFYFTIPGYIPGSSEP
ncbi:MAG: ATP-binding protein [Microcoleaceae cyanobacterium]